MHIGILDLLVIYALPFVILGFCSAIFFIIIFIIVKKDIGHLAMSEDIRFNIQLRKRPFKFSSMVQILLFENGVQAALIYRLGRFFHLRGLNPPAQILHKVSKYITNIDLPPTAKIGPGIVFLHGVNIVIGPYSEAGSHVIFRPSSGMRGWGTVKLEDNVRVGLHCYVMDCVTMGENSESAPGSMVTQDVPANHFAFGLPAKKMIPKPETNLMALSFELENVLLEPSEVLNKALLEALNLPGSKGRHEGKINDLPPAMVIHNILKDDVQREKMLETYIEIARKNIENLRLRPKAKELIEKIRGRGLKVAVLSRQPQALTREILQQLNLAESLDCICGADDYLQEWKPQPWIIFRPARELKILTERFIYVAGTPLDLKTGIAAALRVYWVTNTDMSQPSHPMVIRFPNLESLLTEFSKPQLPQTL